MVHVLLKPGLDNFFFFLPLNFFFLLFIFHFIKKKFFLSSYSSLFLNFILFINFTILYWFCQISKWILHRYTCIPHPEPSSLLPPQYSGLISLKIDWFDLLAVQGLSGVFSSTTVQRHQFFGVVPSLQSSFHNCMWPLGRPQSWLYRPLLVEWCLCFSAHCLGLSLLYCQEAFVFWFHGCSHHLQWFLEPKKRKSVSTSTFSPSICHRVM